MIDTEPMIRLAGRQELDAAAALVTDAFAQYRKTLPAHIFDPYLRDSCDFTSRWGRADIALLEAQGRLVGTVTYYAEAALEGMGWSAGSAGLRTLAVAPSAQGRGYGRALCMWCIRRARQEQAYALVLHTAEFMTAALAAIDLIKKEASQLKQLINDRILTHIDTNILAKHWTANVADNYQNKVYEKVPMIIQLFQERQKAMNPDAPKS